MNVVLMGQFLDYSGYGWAARSYAKLFSKKYKNVHFINYSQESNEIKRDINTVKQELGISEIEFATVEDMRELSGDVYYFQCFLPSVQLVAANGYSEIEEEFFFLEENENINLRKISMVAWETNLFPDCFVHGLNNFGFDALMLHTKHHIENIEEQLNIPVYACAYPVLELYNPEEYEKVEDDKFKIISMSAFNERKGWEQLITAYYSEFFDNEDVVLRVKTHGTKRQVAEEIAKYRNSTVRLTAIYDSNAKIHKTSPLKPKCTLELDTSKLSEK